MSEFQKYTGSTKFYCYYSGTHHGLLSTTRVYPKAFKVFEDANDELLYFGLTDGTNFKNNLKGINNKPIQLTCDQPDCDASVYHYSDNPDNNTGMNIRLLISETSNTRYITFSYNNKYVFKIRQIHKIIYIFTYKFNAVTGSGDSQGDFNDYAYKYNLFLSNYIAFSNGRSDFIKISDKSIKIKDLLFYYTQSKSDSASKNDSIGQGAKLSSIKSSIGTHGWFYPETITNDGYICHMQTYSTATGDIEYLKNDEMPSVLYVLATKNDTDNYIMGTLQKTQEIIYSYIN